MTITIPKDDFLFLLFVAAVIAIVYVVQYARGRRAAAQQLYNDLQLDGYNVEVYPLADLGRGRFAIRVWRNDCWTVVKR